MKPPGGNTPRVKKMASEAGVSSPAATGGAGTVFEQHVNAYWLAHLLVGAIPPILRDSTVFEVYLQTEHLGWNTDDFLVVCVTGSGNRRKLPGQVKRSFTVSATDPECKKAIEDFWKDFKSTERFSAGSDRLALVIRRGTNVLLEDFGGLLDCARAARDASDFEHRLATPGFMTAKAVHNIATTSRPLFTWLPFYENGNAPNLRIMKNDAGARPCNAWMILHRTCFS